MVCRCIYGKRDQNLKVVLNWINQLRYIGYKNYISCSTSKENEQLWVALKNEGNCLFHQWDRYTVQKYRWVKGRDTKILSKPNIEKWQTVQWVEKSHQIRQKPQWDEMFILRQLNRQSEEIKSMDKDRRGSNTLPRFPIAPICPSAPSEFKGEGTRALSSCLCHPRIRRDYGCQSIPPTDGHAHCCHNPNLPMTVCVLMCHSECRYVTVCLSVFLSACDRLSVPWRKCA